MMSNPWQEIKWESYENHMKSDSVFQLQTLNRITKEQLESYQHETVGILGIAGGNGLDEIDVETTNKIYGFDINKDYLDVCQSRYSRLGPILKLVHCDIAEPGFALPRTDLLIANLVIEYVGVSTFVDLISRNQDQMEVVSCTIQNNQAEGFVSESHYTSAFDPLLSISHDVDADLLIQQFSVKRFRCLHTKAYNLPNGKSFIRMDFKRIG